MQISTTQFLSQFRRHGRYLLSAFAAALQGLLVLTLLTGTVRDLKTTPLLVWGSSETEDSASESELPGDSQEPPRGEDEVVPPRQRGDRVASRSAPLPFLLPRSQSDVVAVNSPLLFCKVLPGGRHADRNGLGAPLRC